jgi:hypothetical protein
LTLVEGVLVDDVAKPAAADRVLAPLNILRPVGEGLVAWLDA